MTDLAERILGMYSRDEVIEAINEAGIKTKAQLIELANELEVPAKHYFTREKIINKIAFVGTWNGRERAIMTCSLK